MSAEFIVMFALIMILFIFISMIFLDKYVLVNETSKKNQAKEICGEVTRSINDIYFSHPNTTTSFYLPSTFGKLVTYQTDYTNNSFYVLYENELVACRLFAKNVTGTFTTGSYNNLTRTARGVLIES